mgnify:CR=1 FL=1
MPSSSPRRSWRWDCSSATRSFARGRSCRQGEVGCCCVSAVGLVPSCLTWRSGAALPVPSLPSPTAATTPGLSRRRASFRSSPPSSGPSRSVAGAPRRSGVCCSTAVASATPFCALGSGYSSWLVWRRSTATSAFSLTTPLLCGTPRGTCSASSRARSRSGGSSSCRCVWTHSTSTTAAVSRFAPSRTAPPLGLGSRRGRRSTAASPTRRFRCGLRGGWGKGPRCFVRSWVGSSGRTGRSGAWSTSTALGSPALCSTSRLAQDGPRPGQAPAGSRGPGGGLASRG